MPREGIVTLLASSRCSTSNATSVGDPTASERSVDTVISFMVGVDLNGFISVEFAGRAARQ